MKMMISLRRQYTMLGRGLNHAAASRRMRVTAQFLDGRVRAFLYSGCEGQSLVETAVLMPLLLLILTCMFTMTMALYSYQQLGYATFSAAQQVGAGRGLITDPCATVATAVPNGLPAFTSTKFTYTMVITDSTGATHTKGPLAGSLFTCTALATNLSQNEPVQITVSYQYTWFPAFNLSLSGNLVSVQTVLVD